MRHYRTNAAAFCGLVLLGAGSRLLFRELDIPNLHAVTAVALFAGFYFRSLAMAVAVPITAMALSDSVIGGYDPQIHAAVYAAMLLPLVFRGLLRARMSGLRVAASSVASSLGFFLITNLAVWHAWFPHTAGELWRCYMQALPFLRISVGGDLLFAIALFTCYAWWTEPAMADVPHAKPARVAA